MPLLPGDPKPSINYPHEFMTTITTAPEDQTKGGKGKK
jgi:hypothetical protein